MLVKKLHDNFGISIENIDINSLNAHEKKEIVNLFEEHSLVIIKKQVINEQEQINFTKLSFSPILALASKVLVLGSETKSCETTPSSV